MSILITGNDDLFPAWRHNRDDVSKIVYSAEEDEALGDDWADSPMAFEYVEIQAEPKQIEEDMHKKPAVSMHAEKPKGKPGRKPKVA